jgi:2,4-dienoyl-CoA reductase-like NADH-dependent reductase (Old Yellow Enzyme family)
VHDVTIFSPGRIGNVTTRNRFIRSSTSEGMADEQGVITRDYTRLHLELVRGGVGLNFTGHACVLPNGKSMPGMTGIYDDGHVTALRELTDAVHEAGGKIFAQIQHCGSQSLAPDITPVAPSVIINPQFLRVPEEITPAQIEETIRAFGEAAGRVKAAGFDGVHVHAGHGYLISEFLSPHSNKREDEWGGTLENRQRFGLHVFRAMRAEVGHEFPITWKLGLQDFVPDGLPLEEGMATAELFDAEGVDAIEGSAGLMSPLAESAQTYAGVTRRRALEDGLVHRIFSKPKPEAYFLGWTQELRKRVNCQLILVGGMRTTEAMHSAIAAGHSDFVSLARPLIREPDLVNQIAAGRQGLVDCVSCNICLMHDGRDPLRCWRAKKTDLMKHALLRVTGQLKH